MTEHDTEPTTPEVEMMRAMNDELAETIRLLGIISAWLSAR